MKTKACGETNGQMVVIVNEDSREIYLFGEITTEASCQCIAALRTFDAANSKPITLIINSIGGHAWAAFGIYDAICLARSKVFGQVFGEAASAATIILQACDTRLLAPNSRWMMHNPSQGSVVGSDIRDYRVDMKEIKYLTDLCYEKYAEKSNLSIDAIKKMCETTTYLTPEEAVRYGLADEVLC